MMHYLYYFVAVAHDADDHPELMRGLLQTAISEHVSLQPHVQRVTVSTGQMTELLRDVQRILSVPIEPVLGFEGLGMCYYQRGSFRPPEEGEWFLSDGSKHVYRACARMSVSYRIVWPTHHANAIVTYERGEEIPL